MIHLQKNNIYDWDLRYYTNNRLLEMYIETDITFLNTFMNELRQDTVSISVDNLMDITISDNITFDISNISSNHCIIYITAYTYHLNLLNISYIKHYGDVISWNINTDLHVDQYLEVPFASTMVDPKLQINNHIIKFKCINKIYQSIDHDYNDIVKLNVNKKLLDTLTNNNEHMYIHDDNTKHLEYISNLLKLEDHYRKISFVIYSDFENRSSKLCIVLDNIMYKSSYAFKIKKVK